MRDRHLEESAYDCYNIFLKFRWKIGGPAEPDVPEPAEAQGGEDGGDCAGRICYLLLSPPVPHLLHGYFQ